MAFDFNLTDTHLRPFQSRPSYFEHQSPLTTFASLLDLSVNSLLLADLALLPITHCCQRSTTKHTFRFLHLAGFLSSQLSTRREYRRSQIESKSQIMDSKWASTTIPDIVVIDGIEMSLGFGPPRQVPAISIIPVLTEEALSRPKIKLVGPPSLDAGLSCAVCMGLFVIDSPATIRNLPAGFIRTELRGTQNTKHLNKRGRIYRPYLILYLLHASVRK